MPPPRYSRPGDAWLMANRTTGVVVNDLATGVAEAALRATADTSRQVVALGEVIRRGLAPRELQDAHEAIGQAAQLAVLTSYNTNVHARRRAGSRTGYRANVTGRNRRYAAGALRRALAAPDFYEATPDGVKIINTTRLDREARHWARLNMGAAGRGQGMSTAHTVSFSNLVVGTLGLSLPPRPAFLIPTGYFFSPGAGRSVAPSSGRRGADQFWVANSGPANRARRNLMKRRVSAGIEGRNFLDAGIEAVAKNLGPEYQKMYARLWDRAERAGASGVAARVLGNVSVVRPNRMFGVSSRPVRRY